MTPLKRASASMKSQLRNERDSVLEVAILRPNLRTYPKCQRDQCRVLERHLHSTAAQSKENMPDLLPKIIWQRQLEKAVQRDAQIVEVLLVSRSVQDLRASNSAKMRISGKNECPEFGGRLS
ncbi:MAG: hypothetical protein WBD40_17775 [Tepidisphaeraceae bacterium]